MAKQSCPNCGIPCTGCAGARITTSPKGRVCCTKCLPKVLAEEARVQNDNTQNK